MPDTASPTAKPDPVRPTAAPAAGTAGRRSARPERPRAPVALLLSIVLCYAAAGLGSSVTVPAIDSWYAGLAKPWFNPPDWVFGPVWTLLYGLMALVLWQLWRTPPTDRASARLRRRALIAFVVQLVLNVSWSMVFFGLKLPLLALVVVLALLAAIVWTFTTARPLIGAAALLLVPYGAWVAFAAVLNGAIVVLNW